MFWQGVSPNYKQSQSVFILYSFPPEKYTLSYLEWEEWKLVTYPAETQCLKEKGPLYRRVSC